MVIYTRTGDRGKTSLFDGTRVLKSDERVETYGTVDELNSLVGIAITQIKDQRSKIKNRGINVREELERIQHDLLEVGSALATPAALPVVGLEERVAEFEGLIDQMTEEMPELKNFILPGGGTGGAYLHVCRTVARRAERRVIGLLQTEEVDLEVVKYLNRLSDLFFTMARYVNYVDGEDEVKWRKR